jgi:hypothetical protein
MCIAVELRRSVSRMCMPRLQTAVKEWKSEDEIKAQLRELTAETRKVRQELNALIEPTPTSPSRAFIHKQAWPKNAPPAVVNERRQGRRNKRGR